VVEGLEGALRRDAEDERFLRRGFPDLHRCAVVERAPVQRYLDPAGSAACELAAVLDERLVYLRFHDHSPLFRIGKGWGPPSFDGPLTGDRCYKPWL
jgi:hypothetical protein